MLRSGGCANWRPWHLIKIKTCHYIPESGLSGRSCHPNWDVSASGLILHESGGLSATLAVNRLGRSSRATRPWTQRRGEKRAGKTGAMRQELALTGEKNTHHSGVFFELCGKDSSLFFVCIMQERILVSFFCVCIMLQ